MKTDQITPLVLFFEKHPDLFKAVVEIREEPISERSHFVDVCRRAQWFPPVKLTLLEILVLNEDPAGLIHQGITENGATT